MTSLQADTREVEPQDWDEILAAKDGHPAFALAAILIAMVVTAIAIGRIDTSAGMLRVFALTAGPALVFWVIGYGVTIRHASTIWQLGTLGIALAAAALYFIGVMVYGSMEAKRDLAMLADTRIDAQGLVILPPDADRGPASRVFIAHFAELNAILREREQMVKTLGLDRVADPQSVRAQPALLRDCDRFGRAKTDSDKIVVRVGALMATLPGKLDRAGIEPLVRRELLTGMTASLTNSRSKMRAAGGRLNALFEEAEALCTILARRRWIAQGNAFAFRDPGDLRAFDRHVGSFNDLIREDQNADADMRRSAEIGRDRLRAAAP